MHFINDLPVSLKETYADMYADKSTLTTQAKRVRELEVKLSIYAGIVSTWCRVNQMDVNATKTKIMLV